MVLRYIHVETPTLTLGFESLRLPSFAASPRFLPVVNNRLHPLRCYHSQSITHFAVAVSRQQISNIYPTLSSA
jgi:hypothetical protein